MNNVVKDFLKYKSKLLWKQALTPPQRNIIVRLLHLEPYISKLTWSMSTISISRGIRLCHFCSYHVVDNKTHFGLECPL